MPTTTTTQQLQNLWKLILSSSGAVGAAAGHHHEPKREERRQLGEELTPSPRLGYAQSLLPNLLLVVTGLQYVLRRIDLLDSNTDRYLISNQTTKFRSSPALS
eukprot:SAG31_NODE_98_length_25640_cov_9.936744_1_plen_103_part_00